VARRKEEQERGRRAEPSRDRASRRDEELIANRPDEALPGQRTERDESRGFYSRASERRSTARPRSSGSFDRQDRLGGRTGSRPAEYDDSSRMDRGYGGRSARGYDRPERGIPASGGGYHGQGTGELEQQERGAYGRSRDEYAGERQNRQARGRDAGPYTEARAPRHEGLPADLRAGEGQWAEPGGYAELGQERGAYDPGFESGEWAPGGDASVPLHLGYRDFGVRGHESRSDASRRGRWKREPVLARDIMTSSPASVRPEAGLREIARIMRDENTGIVPVCDANGTLLGVVTDRDIVMRTLASEESPMEATARDVMTDDVEAVTPDENLHDVVHLMGEHQVRRVPVVERGDRLVGIVSMADVAPRADYDEDLLDALEEISARRSFWSRMFR
jgi:CBS domain-containing protein